MTSRASRDPAGQGGTDWATGHLHDLGGMSINSLTSRHGLQHTFIQMPARAGSMPADMETASECSCGAP